MRRLLLAAAFLLAAGCGGTPAHTAADLTNPQLAPAHSQWLVGAISRLATAEEVRQYLGLTDDAAADAFVEAFWQRRNPNPNRPTNPIRQLFEVRAQEADRRFAEAGYLGRRTDRGTVFVLYGAPAKIDFEINPRKGGDPIEHWIYPREAPVGLDRHQPAASYRFVKRGDLTVLYQQSPIDRTRILPADAAHP